jgi:hypothetical protein
MALWRAEALKRLPEFRDKIESADSVMALWIDLSLGFARAYDERPPDESLIGRIYSFADWCERRAPRGPDAGRDPMTAVTVAFYEHIPACEAAREDMPRWFRFSEVADNREVFSYLIGDEAYGALVEHMSKNRKRYRAWREGEV